MTWGNPPPFKSEPPKQGKKITPEQLAGDSESSQQKSLFAWAALNCGQYPALAYMFAIPNGGLRDIRTASTLKAEGVRSGVPDIFLPFAAPKYPSESETWYNGLFIEMKLEKYRNRKNGGCSDEQIDFIEWSTNAGYYCKVCYSWTEARDTLIAYLEGRL
jgi:hypothetical protein